MILKSLFLGWTAILSGCGGVPKCPMGPGLLNVAFNYSYVPRDSFGLDPAVGIISKNISLPKDSIWSEEELRLCLDEYFPDRNRSDSNARPDPINGLAYHSRFAPLPEDLPVPIPPVFFFMDETSYMNPYNFKKQLEKANKTANRRLSKRPDQNRTSTN